MAAPYFSEDSAREFCSSVSQAGGRILDSILESMRSSILESLSEETDPMAISRLQGEASALKSLIGLRDRASGHVPAAREAPRSMVERMLDQGPPERLIDRHLRERRELARIREPGAPPSGESGSIESKGEGDERIR